MQLPDEHTVISRANFPNYDVTIHSKTISAYISMPNCVLAGNAFIHEAGLIRKQFTLTKDILVIDFEAYSVNPLSVSEVGIWRYRNGVCSAFHGILKCDGNYNSDEAAIANIPRDHNLDVIGYEEIVSFIGPNFLIFGKGTDLERRVLRQKMHYEGQIYEVQCLLGLYGKFISRFDCPTSPTMRCEHHQGNPGHCALEDVSVIGERLARALRV